MSTLKEQAQIIRDESRKGANTATRIGNMFVNIVDEVEKKLSSGNLAQGTGSSTTNAMSQNAVTKELAKKLSSGNLAQGTGSSTTNAMSQKAVTTALGTIDKVYFTKLDITTKTDNATISEEDQAEINKIFEASNNGKIVYCKNVGLYSVITEEIWTRKLAVTVGSILYSADVTSTLWSILKRELYNEGGDSGASLPVLYYTESRDTPVENIRLETFDFEKFGSTNIDAKIIKFDVAPSSMYSGPSFLAYDGDYYYNSWKAFGPYKGSEEYLTEGSGYYPKRDVVFGRYGNIELVHYDGTSFKKITYESQGGSVAGIPEAPSDGNAYSRKNKGWTKNIGQAGTGNASEKFNNASNTSSGNYAHAEGDNTTSSGHASHAEGQKTQATGYASHAEGGTTEPEYYTHAEGKFAHAEGNRTHAAKDSSHAEGYATTANGTCSHAEGNKTTATGEDSHAEGNATNAVGLYSHAEGQNSTAKGQAAHAEGNNTKTGECETYDSNYESISTSGNNYAHAEGNNTAAGGMSSHAEGEGGRAFGRAAHAEGQSGAAVGLASHAEGELSMACGEASHAEGLYTQAGSAVLKDGKIEYKGIAAHAEGNQTKALGNHSHAEGYGTKTTNPNEHAQGIFNVSHEHYLTDKATSFSIGIGSNEESRKNGVEVMKNGDVYIIGIGGYDGINIESAKTVQTVISELLGN